MDDPAILICLAIATSIFAVILDHFGDHWRDWTEAEVIVGVLIVLAFTAWRFAVHPEWTAEDYQRAVWLDFAVGGLPIVLWYGWRNRKNYKVSLKKAIRNQHALQLQERGEADEDAQ